MHHHLAQLVCSILVLGPGSIPLLIQSVPHNTFALSLHSKHGRSLPTLLPPFNAHMLGGTLGENAQLAGLRKSHPAGDWEGSLSADWEHTS